MVGAIAESSAASDLQLQYRYDQPPMRICLIAGNRFHHDRKALAAYRALSRAGHDVTVVAVDNRPPRPPVDETVPRRMSHNNRLLRSISSRLLPSEIQERSFRRRLSEACASSGAAILVPLSEDMLEVAVEAAKITGAVVQRSPGMDQAGDVDLIWLAPSKPELTSVIQAEAPALVAGQRRPPYVPEANRYRGESAVICYRRTAANPGRYVESALVRAGFEVRVETESIDLGTVDPKVQFVLFVESPYPAIEVRGSTSVPVLFWVHHGEHHLYPNMRLTERYSADAVLLAHSWHLSPWFPAPVHRFPFAVPPELFASPKSLAERRYDVAMVGAKLHDEAWQYRRRRQLVEEIESTMDPSRVRFIEGVPPEEMAHIYGEARIVLNEGGARHFPITMRVFEAVGSGAALLSDPAPGLDTLLEPDGEYAVLRSSVTTEIGNLLSHLDHTQAMVDRASRRVVGEHTYDHRIDRLMAIAHITEKRHSSSSPAKSDLARLVDRDVEVQRLVHNTAVDLAGELPDREVWPVEEREGRLGPGSMDAAVATSGDATDMTYLLAAARRYIYASDQVKNLARYLSQHHPDALVEEFGRLRRIDLRTESYRATSTRSPA